MNTIATDAAGTRPRRERPKPIKLTEAAAARIQEIMAGADGRYQGVRVGVTNGGCAGMSYTMDYAESPGPLDEGVEDKGLQSCTDPNAVMFLLGKEMAFLPDKSAARLAFTNPNQTAACGCGESVTL